MGKKTKIKEQKSRDIAERYDSVLKRKRRAKKGSKKLDWRGIAHVLRLNWTLGIRDPSQWVPKSYNLETQKIDFVKWVYCKYYVPEFLISSVTNPEEGDVTLVFHWVRSLGAGKSSAKTLKSFLTKKEAHIFLNLKKGSLRYNLWRARALAVGLPFPITHAVAETISLREDAFCVPIWEEFIRFLGVQAQRENIARDDLLEVMDFLSVEGQTFSFKKRTWSSVIRLSNEWHKQYVESRGLEEVHEWKGFPIADWEYYSKKEKTKFMVVQLRNSKDLLREGRKQRNCVGSYFRHCLRGTCFIFSLRKIEDIDQTLKHCVTIEVDKHRIVRQHKGPRNTNPSSLEYSIIHKWATEQGLRLLMRTI